MTTMTKDARAQQQLEALMNAARWGLFRKCPGVRLTFTGSLSIRRADMKSLLTSLGALVLNDVTDSSHTLVVGDDDRTMHPSYWTIKRQNAQDHLCLIVTESELMRMLLLTPAELRDDIETPKPLTLRMMRAKLLGDPGPMLGSWP